MGEDQQLPTLWELIENRLGFQLPSIPMPQTLKNIDKAVSTNITALGENVAARIKHNTTKGKALGKIEIEGIFRSEEERRKAENRADIVASAIDDINSKFAEPTASDADTEIEQDWLNLFARYAEDKSSEELQILFSRILSGEIRKPGSFSLRTLQFLSTLSKRDAEDISNFLSFALADGIVPTIEGDMTNPSLDTRLKMEELGIASSPNTLAGLAWRVTIKPKSTIILRGVEIGIGIANKSEQEIHVEFGCQFLTTPARELLQIANPPRSDFVFLKQISHQVYRQIARSPWAAALKEDRISIAIGTIAPNTTSQAVRFAEVMYDVKDVP